MKDIVIDVNLKLGYEVIITLDIRYLTLVGGYLETVIFTTNAIAWWGQLVLIQRQTDVVGIGLKPSSMLNSATIQDFTWKSRKSSLNWQTPGFTFTSMEQSSCNMSGTAVNPLMGILSKANGTKEGLQYVTT